MGAESPPIAADGQHSGGLAAARVCDLRVCVGWQPDAGGSRTGEAAMVVAQSETDSEW